MKTIVALRKHKDVNKISRGERICPPEADPPTAETSNPIAKNKDI